MSSSATEHHFPLLSSPIKIGPLELKNRICMPAMHLNFTMGGEVSDTLVDFYAERARGGAALITVGGCSVDRLGSGPIMIGLHEDRFVEGLQRLTGAIHEGGALAVAQLYHAGKYAYSMLTGQQSVSASAVFSALTKEMPRALDLEEIAQVQQAFADAARRAEQAGFDGVEVLGSAGYLICQFLSPLSNQRDDQYGGSFENRVRFGREVIEKVCQAVGSQTAVLVRMAGADLVPGGLTSEDSSRVAKVFEQAGAQAINVTGGWHETRVPQLTMGVPRGAFLHLARRIKEVVSVPVMASNRIPEPRLAEEALQDGMADLINFGRPLIADAFLPQKALDGKPWRIVHCVACNQGCFDHVFNARPIRCTVNPLAGQEGRLSLEPAATGRKVLVVGGGPAGMMAAITAARRGHDVTLSERSGRLGGQLLLAGATRDRQEMNTLVADLEQQLEDRAVKVLLNSEVTPVGLEAARPDAVIVATGAGPATIDLEGMDLPHVKQAWDLLRDGGAVGQRVVVVGGGPVAVDVARELAQRGTLDAETLRFLLVNEAEDPEVLRQRCLQGTHQVTMVEMLSKAGKGIGRSTRWTLMQDLKRFGVEVLVSARVERITTQGVEVQQGDERLTLPADTVVLATGSKAEDSLVGAIKEMVKDVKVVGDAKSPRRAFEALHEGFQAGLEI